MRSVVRPIVVDCEQGTKEWHDARLGIATASEFSRIITPKTGKVSASAEDYLCRLLAEWLTGEPEEGYTSRTMLDGHLMEPDAISWYEFQSDCEVKPTGFVYLDERKLIGCSPDGLVGDAGGLEIKAHDYQGGAAHVRFLMSGQVPRKHWPQIQGALWVTGREWWDFVSYHPRIPSAVVRVQRDDDYISVLSAAVETFAEKLLEARQELARRGFEPARAA